ncbi:hypothetical protein M0811_05432 [Anaeramoeba ignava]|uniref:Uncharacterized protein n=1 Tax=Anaeramoeba ignava TaxID=1746090 RepID=A0A9Q0RF14_ANAIG|nr:hypothetical protein M0811_05432 [Anaeramoeba ignava]
MKPNIIMEYFTEEKEKELKMDILKQFYISQSKKEFNIKQTITTLLYFHNLFIDIIKKNLYILLLMLFLIRKKEEEEEEEICIILFYLYYEKKEEFELLSTTKISILYIFNNLIHKQKYLFPFLLFQEFMKIISTSSIYFFIGNT